MEDELSERSEHPRHSQRNLARQVRVLSEAYRSGPRDRPILRTRQDVAAYAVYRMPATYAATRSVLLRTVETVPDFRPQTLLDLGGGTGASLWAAADVVDTLRTAVVLDHLREALTLGRRLAARCPRAVVCNATWCEQTITSGTAVPVADLVTVAYASVNSIPEPVRPWWPRRPAWWRRPARAELSSSWNPVRRRGSAASWTPAGTSSLPG
ncbi:hypothetical protein GCM10023317_46740 [Actinopolymorpha pittospori]|uniref:Ribosomal protein RSM22 (Predicted rRNA methylase) n=1 Tax=Actinopolymorpha pittospori TaxID=648752 RepID=A0A927RL08_9ACTN|nr:small ribosomal subunit Rsm22 family protein [Actinopolymorpha pittospori]MBE1607293.1 ribosomal protein RSM22 (predicted rRNA methylase) [Actinopolymorpha pittospori]